VKSRFYITPKPLQAHSFARGLMRTFAVLRHVKTVITGTLISAREPPPRPSPRHLDRVAAQGWPSPYERPTTPHARCRETKPRDPIARCADRTPRYAFALGACQRRSTLTTEQLEFIAGQLAAVVDYLKRLEELTAQQDFEEADVRSTPSPGRPRGYRAGYRRGPGHRRPGRL
jgi:hypothetical protein